MPRFRAPRVPPSLLSLSSLLLPLAPCAASELPGGGVPPEILEARAEVERGMAGLDSLVRELEESAKSYPSVPDLGPVSSRRGQLRARIFAKAGEVKSSLNRFDSLRGEFEYRQGAGWLGMVATMRPKVPPRRKRQAAAAMIGGAPGDKTRSALSDVYDLREFPRKVNEQLRRTLDRMRAEEELFSTQRAARAELEHARLAWLSFGGTVLLGMGLWSLLRARSARR